MEHLKHHGRMRRIESVRDGAGRRRRLLRLRGRDAHAGDGCGREKARERSAAVPLGRQQRFRGGNGLTA